MPLNYRFRDYCLRVVQKLQKPGTYVFFKGDLFIFAGYNALVK